MSPEFVADLARDTFLMAFLIAGPALAVGLFTGLVVSMFQAVTQINEMTLSFIPKIAAIALALLLGTPWMLERFQTFARRIFDELPRVIG